MRLYSFVFIIAAVFLMGACRTQRAVYNYLEDIKDTSFKQRVYIADQVVQKNDLLSIQVFSASTDEKANALYNLPIQPGMIGSGQGQGQLGGYLVDVNGNIEMPRIGVIKAEGLTKNELSEVIKAKLEKYLTQPGVIIRFLNFRITVLGEVGAPGVLNVPTERLTILEAIGMSGGVTEFGKIKEVKVLRENNGVRQLGVLDLTSARIFQSPYYQLQQNDVVYVDQGPYKLRQTEQARVAQQIGFATGIISTLALLITIFNRR